MSTAVHDAFHRFAVLCACGKRAKVLQFRVYSGPPESLSVVSSCHGEEFEAEIPPEHTEPLLTIFRLGDAGWRNDPRLN